MTTPLISDAELEKAAYRIADGMSFSIAQIERVKTALSAMRSFYESRRQVQERIPAEEVTYQEAAKRLGYTDMVAYFQRQAMFAGIDDDQAASQKYAILAQVEATQRQAAALERITAMIGLWLNKESMDLDDREPIQPGDYRYYTEAPATPQVMRDADGMEF